MNKKLIDTLQQKLWSSLETAVPDRKSKYAILDFPNHSNIGDSAIYIGEEILLRRYFGREASIVTEAFDSDIDDVEKIADRIDVIFLHGGGNFGDLWPRHQKFREAVIGRFPTKKIVQLPQTIFYSDDVHLRHSAEIINKHPDFTLMIRDRKSEQIARGTFKCAVHLTPDMALMIGVTKPSRRCEFKVLGLMRDDQEGKFTDTSALERLPRPNIIVDWPVEHNKRSIWNRIKGKIFRGAKKRKTPKQYRGIALSRLQTGFDLLSRGEVVVTDRLHAHILSILLGKPHVVLDNFYGKISTFIDAWTRGGDFHTAKEIEEAVDLVDLLSERVRHTGSKAGTGALIGAAVAGGIVGAYAAGTAARHDPKPRATEDG